MHHSQGRTGRPTTSRFYLFPVHCSNFLNSIYLFIVLGDHTRSEYILLCELFTLIIYVCLYVTHIVIHSKIGKAKDKLVHGRWETP